MNINGLLGRTFTWGKNSCWRLERRQNGRLVVVAASVLADGAEVEITYWMDDEEECWSTSLYSASPDDDYEPLAGQIPPEEHARLLKFRDMAEKILRRAG
jgi:hypothetical protein